MVAADMTELCKNCGNKIEISIFKGTGWCSDDCRKVLTGENDIYKIKPMPDSSLSSNPLTFADELEFYRKNKIINLPRSIAMDGIDNEEFNELFQEVYSKYLARSTCKYETIMVDSVLQVDICIWHHTNSNWPEESFFRPCKAMEELLAAEYGIKINSWDGQNINFSIIEESNKGVNNDR